MAITGIASATAGPVESLPRPGRGHGGGRPDHRQNGAVAATQAARRRRLARVLRLAGSAPRPEFFEIDDSLVPASGDAQEADIPHLTT
ncbi:MAG: hypothetical protein ACRDNZ_24240 [Streptosporangiaceae bacterium]